MKGMNVGRLAPLALLAMALPAANAASVEPFPEPRGMVCVLEVVQRFEIAPFKEQQCVEGKSVFNPLKAENETVTKLLFSLSSSTSEAEVMHVLRRYASKDGGEMLYPCTEISMKSVEWLIPRPSSAKGRTTSLFMTFLDGKVSFVEWNPIETLIFNRRFSEVVGGCPPA